MCGIVVGCVCHEQSLSFRHHRCVGDRGSVLGEMAVGMCMLRRDVCGVSCAHQAWGSELDGLAPGPEACHEELRPSLEGRTKAKPHNSSEGA